MYRSDLEAPAQWQFSADSAPDQQNNCGPSVITGIAEFYRDTNYGIEATRHLVTWGHDGTTASQQRDMLIKRGVPAAIYAVTSLSQIIAIVGSGKRPADIRCVMSRVPSYVRDHNFLGTHSLRFRSRAIAGDGSRGFWVNDPDFSPPGGYRPDPDRGMKFYSDAVVQYAIVNDPNHWMVVPKSAKYVPTTRYVSVVAGARMRRSASGSGSLYTTLTKTTSMIYSGTVSGGSYTYWNGSKWATGTQWTKVYWQLQTLYVISPFAHLLAGADHERAAAEPDLRELGLIEVPESVAESSALDPVPDEREGVDPATWQDDPETLRELDAQISSFE